LSQDHEFGREGKVGVSYYTKVRIDYYSEDGSVTADMLLAEARVYLSGFEWYAVDDILSDLAEGFKTGSATFSDLRESDLEELFLALSQKYPTVRLDVWGLGEEFGDAWAIRFLGGEITVNHKPIDDA